jgi:hypothetical protein
MNDQFVAYLHECFQGEVLGEALGATLAEAAQDPAHSQKWRFVEQLERETKGRIRTALEALGEAVEEDPEKRTEGKAWAERWAKLSWSEAMDQLKPALEKYIRYFEKHEKTAPSDGLAIAQHITRHERALLEFTLREIEGQTDSSVEPIERLLDKPPLAA